MDPETNEKIARLQILVAHLERQYDELNQVVTDQTREIHRLQQRLARMSDTVDSMELERIKSTNPRPPHSVI